MLQLRDYDPKADKIFVHRLKGSNSGEHHLVREEARARIPVTPQLLILRPPFFLSCRV